LQLGASLVVLFLLLREADPAAVWGAIEGASIPFLILATVLKILGVSLHELRLWLALKPYKEVPIGPVFGIGYLAGLLNVVLPVRGGDLLAIALLKRELDVPGPAALAAVGLTGFFEAAVFGVFLLCVMAFGATQWEALLGAAETFQAMGTLTGLTLGAVFGSAVLVLVARKLSAKPQEGPPKPGILSLIRESIVRTGEGLSAWGPLAANLALAALQVILVVASFWALLPALGLSVAYPVLATCGVIAIGAMAAIVLPPGLGAGQAAAAVFVLGFFGVSEAEAIAFTALSWVSNTVPPLVTGIGPLVGRLGRVREILGRS
jgi:uncharacterized membrane protein YbhN (UPF0104 family)